MDFSERALYRRTVVKKRAFLTVTLLSLVPFGAHANVPQGSPASDRQFYDASLAPSGRVTTPWTTNPAAALSRDPARGVPNMLVSPTSAVPARGSSPEEAARFHLLNTRDVYKVSRAALSGARLRFVHDLGRGGIVVSLKQMLAGVEVFHGDIKVLLDRDDLRLVSIAGAPHPAAVPGNRQRFVIGKQQAITNALADLYGPSRAAVPLAATGQRKGGWEYFELGETRKLRFREPARVKPVYFPIGDALVAGWFLEVQVRRGGQVDAFQFVVAANDGRLLYRRNLTDHEMYKYRVWAEPGGDRRPLDGPMEDWTPHPTGMPDQGPVNFTIPTLIQVDGLNKNPMNLPDPWLPPGATETNGNNVDAYVDWNDPDGLDGMEFRTAVSGNKTFDYIYNTAAEPLATTTQSKAAIVQLFYSINWLHDWWYDSGFIETTGVAQLSNYGRGGVEGDPLKAEAQDGALKGSRNNANMSTPADGEKPRMQMFLWNKTLSNLSLDIQPSGLVTHPNAAAFGPKNYDVMGEIVLVNDGMGMSPTDLCEDNLADLTGKIALIDRGTCTFESKVARAQAKGAIAAIIANNTGNTVNPGMGLDPNTPDPMIPSVGVWQDDGVALKAALQQNPQTGHLIGSNELLLERDGTIDNMVVAHEFGHYLHHRLQECGTRQCGAMSEGWGDFNAAMMALREGDDLDGVFADSTYASYDETGYFGIRRVPYSASFAKNALTFKHVTDDVALPNTHPIQPGGVNSEVHNAGEIWCTTMWQAYIDMQKDFQGDMTFAEINRQMSDYVVAGLMMTPVDPTFTEMRDGILAAARANDENHFMSLANAFAVRGMGSCAVSPAKDSIDFKGVVEDFELHANGVMTGLPTISDDILSCDDDGVVDVGEVGSIRVTVTNIGALFLPKGSTVEILDPPASLTFPDGLTAPVDALAPYQSIEAVIPVTVNEPLADNIQEIVKIRLNTPAGCVNSTETFLPIEFNADLSPNSSASDDVEPITSAWTPGGGFNESVWSRQPTTDGWLWHGNDIGIDTDTNLTTPTLNVSNTDPFIISFEHRFQFEFSDNTYWDGGLVEISEDDGMTWKDASDYGASPTYIAAIASMANPINGKMAYADHNAAYPNTETEVLDFGTALAGKAVKFRFRIGTDAAAGAPGWDIDDINFEGITNTPFISWIPDEAVCMVESTTGESSTTASTTDGNETGGTGSTGGTGGTGGETGGTGTGSGTGGETGAETGTDGGTTQGLDTSAGESDTSAGTLETSASESSADTTADPSETSATPTEGSAGSDSEGVPTTGFDPSNPSTPSNPSGPESDSGEEEGETDTDPGEIVDDEGCGCGVDDEHGWGWQVAPWLALLGLGRRRRRM